MASHNQAVVNVIGEWLEWSQTMKAKPKKCKSAAMIGGKPMDPKLMIGGSLMGYIDKVAFLANSSQRLSPTKQLEIRRN